MDQTHKKSFFIILSLIFLLPIFFIPGGALSVQVSKSAFLVLAFVVATLIFISEIWREGKLSIVWHPFVIVAILLPVVYFISALFTTSSLSLFGYNFEAGTFGFILVCSLMMLLIPIVFTDISRNIQAIIAFFASFSLIILFALVKMFFDGFPVLGIFFDKTTSPIGNWTDLAVASGLLAVSSAISLGILPIKKFFKIFIYGIFVFSVILLSILNFYVAFIFTLGASIIIIVYFSTVEKHFFVDLPESPSSLKFFLKPNFLPIILAIISIVFLINPTVPSTDKDLKEVVSNAFNISNIEVRPSFSTTLNISKAVLSNEAFLGSGPNTFMHNWLVYKPVEVNVTPFWGTNFLFGFGFIPTQIASTGIVGILLWLSLFLSLVFLLVKSLTKIPESRNVRFVLILSCIATIYLWASSFMYAPSYTLLVLAFIFSGIFVATVSQMNVIQSRVIILSKNSTTNFFSIIVMLVFVLGIIYLGYISFNKNISAIYFNKAIDLSNTPETTIESIESALEKVFKFAPTDIHYVALSRINFVKAQIASTNAENTPEKNLSVFKDSISKSIEAANMAIKINPSGYQNWMTLGIIYDFLVPAPLNISGAYENAVLAYSEAEKRNPNSPEVPLFLARLELGRGNVESARTLIRKSLVLKEDYADAYLMLTQIEVQDNNLKDAIASAERLALLIPNNSSIYFELGLLKYFNKDYAESADIFALILNSIPDYANAQYYLGMSLAQLGKLAEAQRQFEALSLTNPENEEIRLIIEELKTGTKSFLNK